jgi:hypothetical protein
MPLTPPSWGGVWGLGGQGQPRRSTVDASDYFGLPPEQPVTIGARIAV